MILNLKTKLIISYVLIAIISIGSITCIFGYIAIKNSEKTLINIGQKKLSAIREAKKQQIESYFSTIINQVLTFADSTMLINASYDFINAYQVFHTEYKDKNSNFNLKLMQENIASYYHDMFLEEYKNHNKDADIDVIAQYNNLNEQSVIFQHEYISNNKHPLGNKDKLNDSLNNTLYDKIHLLYHSHIRNFLNKFQYYDIFIVEPETGYIVYSVFKELDFATSLKTGPYANTGIGIAFKEGLKLQQGESYLTDFDEYRPSYDNQASFISSPVYHNGKLISILIFQMPIDVINNIMTHNGKWQQAGLGNSGETYLVGDDFKMRSQSRFLLEDKDTMIAMLKKLGIDNDIVNNMELKDSTIGVLEVKTVGTEDALQGNSGFKIFSDYRDVSVFSSYSPLTIKDFNWVIMSEIDAAEALENFYYLKDAMLCAAVIILIVILILAAISGYLFAKYFATRINGAAEIADKIAKGNFDNKIKTCSRDEIGSLLRALDAMQSELRAKSTKDMLYYSGQIDAIHRSLLVLEIKPDRTICKANENFLDATGYSAREMNGKSYDALVDHATLASNEYKTLWDKLNLGKYQIGEYSILCKNGKEIWMQATFNAIYNIDKTIDKIIMYSSNTTEQKVKNAAYHSEIQGNSRSQMVVEYDMEGKIIDANENFLKALNYTFAEVKGKPYGFLQGEETPANEIDDNFWSALRKGEYKSGEYKFYKKNGAEIWVHANYNPILDLSNKPFKIVKYASDITSRITDVSLISAGLARLASGDLTCAISDSMHGEFEKIRNIFNTTTNKLIDLISNINSSATKVEQSVSEVSNGNKSLQQRTEEQASTIEETSSSMDAISKAVKENDNNAKQSLIIADQAKNKAEQGREIVSDVVSAMDSITASSKKINDIIGVIDEIAFQTNLLALNAAVEAARAGEKGRGFAVVASEVRNLAQRSAENAKEIRDLIKDSTDKVSSGSKLAMQSGEALKEIVEIVSRVNAAIQSISNSFTEQSSSIEEINVAIRNLDAGTQENSALVEEITSISTEMSDESKELKAQVSKFNIDAE